jgi:hypothetical protein
VNGNTSTELWERIEPELLRQMVKIFANAGRGVSIVETESSKEEDK